jgi:glycosyltransferase involved in cell wall biosynthesis
MYQFCEVSLPLVSIITPAFNNAATLDDTAKSVFSQTYGHWQWILVNNGSQDETAKCMDRFAQDPRVITVHLPENLGVSAGRNAGLDRATGAYICFLDADDLLSPTSLAHRIEVMENHPHVDFVDGAVERIDEQGKSLSIHQPRYAGNPLPELLTLSENCFVGITWMIRKKTGQSYQFKPGLTHAEDLHFFLSIAQGGEYVAVSEVIYYYRTRKGSAMQNLVGLEKGYAAVEEEIRSWNHVHVKDVKRFHRTWRRIMIKSYVKTWQLSDALRLWLR